jgi:DNA-binding transcriptional ArsR family regulator
MAFVPVGDAGVHEGQGTDLLPGVAMASSLMPPIEPLANHPFNDILNLMVQYQSTRLDSSFAALSDATRRGVVDQLSRSDASITDLAETFHMTLTGMKKHVAVLERAGLVATVKIGRVRTCKLGRHALAEEAAWIERYRQLWATRFDELDQIIEESMQKEKANDRKAR